MPKPTTTEEGDYKTMDDDANKIKRELYKLEYERCTDRYEKIYNSIWNQFNYYLVAAAAVLGFGKSQLGLPFAATIACAIISLWWLGAYEPLNRYGDGAKDRAAEIETELNKLFFADDTSQGGSAGMQHFRRYKGHTVTDSQKKDWFGRCLSWLHVRGIVRLVGLAALAGVIYFASKTSATLGEQSSPNGVTTVTDKQGNTTVSIPASKNYDSSLDEIKNKLERLSKSQDALNARLSIKGQLGAPSNP